MVGMAWEGGSPVGNRWGSQNAPNVSLKRGALIPCLPLPPPPTTNHHHHRPASGMVWCVVRHVPGNGQGLTLVVPLLPARRHRSPRAGEKKRSVSVVIARPCVSFPAGLLPALTSHLRIRVRHGTLLKFDLDLSMGWHGFLMVRCRFPPCRTSREARFPGHTHSQGPCRPSPSPGQRVILARSLLAATEMMCSNKCQPGLGKKKPPSLAEHGCFVCLSGTLSHHPPPRV